MKIIYFFLFSTFFVETTQLLSATVNEKISLLALGDSLSSYGSYDEAITEYKRFIFFHPTDSQLSYAYSKRGLAYQNIGQWDKSIHSFLRAIELSSDAELTNKNRISISVSSLSSGDYHLALLELHKVISISKDSTNLRKAYFFKTIAYIYLEDWIEAGNSFRFFVKDSSVSKNSFVQKIDSLLARSDKLEYKSVQKAKIFSTILPGAGQFYAGHYKDAVNAFALNGVNFSFIYHLINTKAYVDSALFFLYVGIRYYNGNRYHAVEKTTKFNKDLLNHHKLVLFKYLLEYSQSF